MKNLYIISLALLVAFSCEQTKKEQSEPEIHQGYSDTAHQYEAEGNVVSNVDTEAFLWNPRGKTEEQLAARAKFLTESSYTRSEEQKKADIPYMEKYKDAIVINTLMPTTVGLLGNTQESFTRGVERNRSAGVTHFSASAGGFHTRDQMMANIEASNPVLDSLGVEMVQSAQHIRNAKSAGTMTMMYNSQGFDYEVDHLDFVPELFENGIKIFNFVYNKKNAFATGIEFNENRENKDGLTDLGREFVKMANEKGIIVDVSHSSDAAAIEAASITTKPIMASHNNPWEVYNISRNMSDEAIKAVASTGGVICINGVGVFLSEDATAQAETLAKHVQYIADLVGKECTCYGSDYTHNLYDAMMIQVPMVDKYPPEKGFGAPSQMAGIEDVWAIVALLETKYNWTENEIRGFLGENVMRVYEANWE